MSRLTLQTRATSLEAGTKTILETTTFINVTLESQNVLMPLSTILSSLDLFGNNILFKILSLYYVSDADNIDGKFSKFACF